MDDPLPWDMIDCGVEKTFLAREYIHSLNGQLTRDCRSAECYACGVCSEDLNMVIAEVPQTIAAVPRSAPSLDEGVVTQLRIQFAKRGKAAFLSHLELSSAIIRAITIGGFSFSFSEGFHPHPRISFSYALPVGIESLGEYADIQLRLYRGPADDFIARVNSSLPEGITILHAETIAPHSPSLSSLIEGFDYRICLPPGTSPFSTEKIETFLSSDTFPVSRYKKGGTAVKDIRPLVTELSINSSGDILALSTRFDPASGVKPFEVLTQVLGYDDDTAKRARIIKTRVRRKNELPNT
jgi:radical SAM-linked protein